jgi:hypothetical protein
MTTIIIAEAGNAVDVENVMSRIENEGIKVVLAEDTSMPACPSINDIMCFELAVLPDTPDIGVVFIPKLKTNPCNHISAWHFQLAILLTGYRKTIYWKRIRSRTWTKSKKANVAVFSVIPAIIIIALIIQL